MIGLPLNIKQYREKRRYQMYLLHIQIKSIDPIQGRIQDFKLRGGALKKIAPSRGRRENILGISCEKSQFYTKKSYFFQF
jgi:hypothetical protein